MLPAALVRHFQPHRFRVTQLLPPHEVARLSLHPAGGGSSSSSPSTAASQSKPAAAGVAPKAGLPPVSGSSSLPYVPEFFSLAEAVRVDDRLLLRHSDAGATPAAGEGWSSGSSVSAWAAAGASAALSSPSCLLRSLAFLFWGGGTSGGGAAAATRAPASPVAAPHAPPVLLLPPPAAPLRQQSSEWTLAAMPSGPRVASGDAAAGGARSGGAAAGGGRPAPAQLEHAVSVDARPLSQALGSGSTGSIRGIDEGHLLPAGTAGPDPDASNSGRSPALAAMAAAEAVTDEARAPAAPAKADAESPAQADAEGEPSDFWWQYC